MKPVVACILRYSGLVSQKFGCDFDVGAYFFLAVPRWL